MTLQFLEAARKSRQTRSLLTDAPGLQSTANELRPSSAAPPYRQDENRRVSARASTDPVRSIVSDARKPVGNPVREPLADLDANALFEGGSDRIALLRRQHFKPLRKSICNLLP